VSFRFEDKVSTGKSESFHFFEDLRAKGFKVLYPKRKIYSIYFDTSDLNMFVDSEEGSLPRKKIRIRHYPLSFEKKFNLELKISSIEGRYKDTKVINLETKDSYSKFGIFDNQYGLIFPVCVVTYDREYFYKDEMRVTHDSAIEYFNYNKPFSFRENREVIEIKTPNNFNRNLIENFFPFSKHRFSKYCEAIKSLRIK